MWFLVAQVESSIQALLARQQQLQSLRDHLSRTVALNARAPKADWQGFFAWDQEVQHLLRDAFGLLSFRSGVHCLLLVEPAGRASWSSIPTEAAMLLMRLHTTT